MNTHDMRLVPFDVIRELIDADKELAVAVNFCEPTENLDQVTSAEYRSRAARSIVEQALAASPSPSVEDIERAAYKRGWDDRESDLLSGVARIYPAPDASAVREGEWKCAESLLSWLNTLEEVSLRKTDVYAWAMAYRPQITPSEPAGREELRSAIDEITNDVLPTSCDVTGNGTQARAQMQVEIANRVIALFQNTGSQNDV